MYSRYLIFFSSCGVFLMGNLFFSVSDGFGDLGEAARARYRVRAGRAAPNTRQDTKHFEGQIRLL